MEKVLIVGAGITGALTAASLRRTLQEKIQIYVWDKARGPGGRMTSTRNPNNSRNTVDLGAQYITVCQKSKKKHSKLYEELLHENVLQPFLGTIEGEKDAKPGAENFVCTQGFSSLVQFYLTKTADVQYGCHVTHVDMEADGHCKLKVSTSMGEDADFDVVVLTMPVPQIIQLLGGVHGVLDAKPEIRENLQSVNYSSRFALALFYKPGTDMSVPWTAKYFSGPCIRYISVENRKKGLDQKDVGSSLLVHTSVPFGLEHVEEDKKNMISVILKHLNQVLPNLPPPEHVMVTKWRYSQVHDGYKGSPGCLVLLQKPLLICGGDAFTYSKFEGCVESAAAITQAITQQMNK